MTTDGEGRTFMTRATNDDRCKVCMGEPGDDSRRCERPAHPVHASHLIDGIYHHPVNNTEVLIDGHRDCCGWKADDEDA